MNKFSRTVFIIGILSLIYSCGGQKKSNSISDLPKEFFQRWKLDYGIADGNKMNGLPRSPINDYEFKRNGEYILYKRDGTFITGTWEYNRVEKVIYTKRSDGELNGKISDLKSESIILIPAGKAVEGTPFEKFKFYYVPKTE